MDAVEANLAVVAFLGSQVSRLENPDGELGILPAQVVAIRALAFCQAEGGEREGGIHAHIHVHIIIKIKNHGE